MQKWEYLIVTRNTISNGRSINEQYVEKQKINFMEYIKKLGQEGWELVSQDNNYSFCFKRPLP